MSLVALLDARRARRSRSPHDDGAKIGLAIEGGAMRGVISAGMVWALEDLGLTHAFDAVYGSSAGAISAAYFLAGQAGLGTTIFYEDINNRAFINMWRALAGRAIVNIDFLLEDVSRKRKVLDVDRLLNCGTPLTVMATDVETQRAHAFTDLRSGAALRRALHAGATMPIVAGGPFEVDGRRYLDASLSEPIPVPQAEADGCTHVLVLLTRGAGMQPHPSAFDRHFVAPRLRAISEPLARQYLARARPYADLVHAIDKGRGPQGRADVMGIRVDDMKISKLERRRDVLVRGARRGYDAVLSAFSATPDGRGPRPQA